MVIRLIGFDKYFKVALRMGTGWAEVWGLVASVDVAAIIAFPLNGVRLFNNCIIDNIVIQLSISGFMVFFHFSDLTENTSGRILVDEKEVVEPGMDRRVVFQEYSLFPWLSVEDNL
ncbi:hypothetical protein SPSIL_045400 [Sporomusa silvacetica DSM 10669]|uniref:Uncharacterized protein n=1 Tax=Sporomusa silvacetica DSM 10669 TaxID=1123289 RepID=A0ABZ3IRL2_9FIRM|nr:hypothetical protein [Sporomusa silvacetica]OZC20797.1 bicarbonate transport ATP-binding protein CmpC [Sporomusa silvacetica DSM 10669]